MEDQKKQFPRAMAPEQGQGGIDSVCGMKAKGTATAVHNFPWTCCINQPSVASAPQNHFNLVMVHLPERISAVKIISFLFLPVSPGNYACSRYLMSDS